jgi:hypothetical protein
MYRIIFAMHWQELHIMHKIIFPGNHEQQVFDPTFKEMTILFRPFDLFAHKDLNYLAFQPFDYERF